MIIKNLRHFFYISSSLPLKEGVFPFILCTHHTTKRLPLGSLFLCLQIGAHTLFYLFFHLKTV
nr:MAG TPA: hypothetical protein [Caudoviricetes sp.]